jgi:hypothetical protein
MTAGHARDSQCRAEQRGVQLCLQVGVHIAAAEDAHRGGRRLKAVALQALSLVW